MSNFDQTFFKVCIGGLVLILGLHINLALTLFYRYYITLTYLPQIFSPLTYDSALL